MMGRTPCPLCCGDQMFSTPEQLCVEHRREFEEALSTIETEYSISNATLMDSGESSRASTPEVKESDEDARTWF